MLEPFNPSQEDWEPKLLGEEAASKQRERDDAIKKLEEEDDAPIAD